MSNQKKNRPCWSPLGGNWTWDSLFCVSKSAETFFLATSLCYISSEADNNKDIIPNRSIGGLDKTLGGGYIEALLGGVYAPFNILDSENQVQL